MQSVVPISQNVLHPAVQVRQRYGVSDMTLHRWLGDEKLKFPKPLRINGRRYWRLSELEAFEARQSEEEAA